MSIGVGKTKHSQHYTDIKGLKVTSGQLVKTGTILTREGNKWKAGINVSGRNTLYALTSGEVYFQYKKGSRNKCQTFINIKEKKEKKS